MRARLYCKHGDLKGLSFDVADEATIGRSPSNAIALDPAGISSKHARITFDRKRDRYVLEDLGSTNGTELDGVPITEPEPLGHLHVVTLAGRHDFIFQDLHLCSLRQRAAREGDSVGLSRPAPGPPPQETVAEDLAVALPAGLAGKGGSAPADATVREELPLGLPKGLGGAAEEAAPQPAAPQPVEELFLEVLLEAGTERFRLSEGDLVIGRTVQAEIKLDLPAISRRHARLRVRKGVVWVEDLGSANHTFVNGERIEGEVRLEADDVVRFGNVEARIHRETRG